MQEGLQPRSRRQPTDPLRVTGERLFIPVTVNGIETEALLDSGAEMTLIDAGFARRLGLTSAGEAVARRTGGSQPVRFAENVSLQAVDFPEDTVWLQPRPTSEPGP